MISSIEDEKKKLVFKNGSVEEGFDLVIGVDGIHF
jgi:hypothetical protein